MTVSQKDAVYNSVVSFLSEKGVVHEDNVKVELDRDDRKSIVLMLVEATKAGIVEIKSESARADMEEYWSGTLSNWLRRDMRLNGGVVPETKNPGSRAGAGDPELRELKKALVHPDYAHLRDQVQEAIDNRMRVIAEERATKVEINMDLIPESLRAVLGA